MTAPKTISSMLNHARRRKLFRILSWVLVLGAVHAILSMVFDWPPQLVSLHLGFAVAILQVSLRKDHDAQPGSSRIESVPHAAEDRATLKSIDQLLKRGV